MSSLGMPALFAAPALAVVAGGEGDGNGEAWVKVEVAGLSAAERGQFERARGVAYRGNSASPAQGDARMHG